MGERKQRSDKGRKRVEHSGHDRIYSFKLNTLLNAQAIEAIETLKNQHGNTQNAMLALLSGGVEIQPVNAQSLDEKLNSIMLSIESLRNGVKAGKPATAKQKANVVDAVKEYCANLSDFFD